MKKIYLSLSLAWMVVLSVEARPKGNWSKGEIRLATGEHLRGEILYAPEVEVVSISAGEGRLLSFGTRQVISFAFWDEKNQQTRQFVRGYLQGGKEVIFETVDDGRLEIRRRFKPYSRKKIFAFTSSTTDGFPETSVELSRFEYFVCEQGVEMSMEQFLRNRYTIVTNHRAKELNKYRQVNDLDNSITSWVLVLIYFNLLESKHNQRD